MAVEQVERTLRNLPPSAITHEHLKVSPSNVDSDGVAETAQVSWQPKAWFKNVDLVAEMDRVRQHLNANFTACWSTSAGDDRRCVGQFNFAQRSSSVTITAAQATASVRKFCELKGHDVRCMAALGFGNDPGGARKSRVIVTLKHPESMRQLEKQVAEETGKGGSFLGVSCKVTFRPTQDVVPVPFPSMIVGLDRSEVPHDDLVAELEYIVKQFNTLYGVAESLLPLGPERFVSVYDEHVFAIPSCIGLAEFICQQPVTGAPPYELAFRINGKNLKSADAVAMSQDCAVPQKSEKVRTDVGRPADEVARLRSEVTCGVKEMSKLNANFGTFGADLLSNLGRLFSQLKRSTDVDSAVLTERVSSLTHEMELRLVKLNTDLVDCQIKLLESERDVKHFESEAAGASKEEQEAIGSSGSGPDSDTVLGQMLADGGFSLSSESDRALADDLQPEQQAKAALAAMSRAANVVGPQVPGQQGIRSSFSRDMELKLLLARRKKLVESQMATINHLKASRQYLIMLGEQRNKRTTLRDSTGLGILAKVKGADSPADQGAVAIQDTNRSAGAQASARTRAPPAPNPAAPVPHAKAGMSRPREAASP